MNKRPEAFLSFFVAFVIIYLFSLLLESQAIISGDFSNFYGKALVVSLITTAALVIADNILASRRKQ